MTYFDKKRVPDARSTWNFARNQITSGWKNIPKLLFYLWPETLWKLNLKFTNIHKIFVKYLNTYNQFLGLHIQLVPKKIHILPAAYLNCNWLCCKLPISSWPYSTSPQKYIKSETGQKTIPKYSVWNNWISRKWGRRKKVLFLKF